MADCRFCGEPAGILRHEHAACREKYDLARQKIPEFFVKEMTAGMPLDRFKQLADQIAADNFIGDDEYQELAVIGLAAMVGASLADDVVTAEEEALISQAVELYGVDADDPVWAGPARKLKKNAILRQLGEGKLPGGIEIDGLDRVNLDRDEHPIWLFNDARCMRVRSHTQYRGGSTGVSVRVVKGMSFRVGAFRGEPVQTKALVEDGVGSLLITDRRVVFISPMRSLRIDLRKVVTIDPYSDGVGLTLDGAEPKPYVFMVDDPWFAANAIMRLSRMRA